MPPKVCCKHLANVIYTLNKGRKIVKFLEIEQNEPYCVTGL